MGNNCNGPATGPGGTWAKVGVKVGDKVWVRGMAVFVSQNAHRHAGSLGLAMKDDAPGGGAQVPCMPHAPLG